MNIDILVNEWHGRVLRWLNCRWTWALLWYILSTGRPSLKRLATACGRRVSWLRYRQFSALHSPALNSRRLSEECPYWMSKFRWTVWQRHLPFMAHQHHLISSHQPALWSWIPMGKAKTKREARVCAWSTSSCLSKQHQINVRMFMLHTTCLYSNHIV